MADKNLPLKKPDFICIGPPKTATTWLYAILKHHDQVDIPLVKELTYFWGNNFNYKKGIGAFLTDNDWYNTRKRRIFMRISKEPIRNPTWYSFKNLRWHYYFLLFPQSDKWYRGLFDKSNNKVSMDISPTYAYLDSKDIESIYFRFSHLKIIIVLRNPIYRTWSHLKMKLSKEQQVIPEELKLEAAKDYYNKTLLYSSLVSKWVKPFPRDQIHILFYDDLVNDPLRFYENICKILKINPGNNTEKILNNLSRTYHQGETGKIPVQHEKYLGNLYKKDLIKLDKMLEEPTIKKWLKHIDSL